MEKNRLKRRLRVGCVVNILLATALVVLIGYAFNIEPYWIKVVPIELNAKPTLRIVHITDLHYEGEIDRKKMERLVRIVKDQKPDVIAVTGDLVDEEERLADLLDYLKRMGAPLVGCKGNHDIFDLRQLKEVFRESGGGWLESTQLEFKGVLFYGISSKLRANAAPAAKRRVLLCHYPAVADHVDSDWDVILSGHTHGGQVKIPFYGPVVTPYDTGRYTHGLYHTPHGPIYVNTGIGTYFVRVRFNCRPQVAVIDL